MPIYITTMVVALVFAVGAFAPTHPVSAALITNNDVEDQKAVVHESIRLAMLEQVKLIQMVFIQLLETRVAELQAQQTT